jgi:hypothetical protein
MTGVSRFCAQFEPPVVKKSATRVRAGIGSQRCGLINAASGRGLQRIECGARAGNPFAADTYPAWPDLRDAPPQDIFAARLRLVDP